MPRDTLKRIENALLVLFCVLLGGAFLVSHWAGPGWAANALIALCFLLAAPYAALTIRRQWRGE